MQKNIKFKNINLDLDSVDLQFTSQQSKLTFSFLGDQIVFDDVDDESSNIRFKQTTYDDVFIKLEDGIFKFEDIAGDLKYSLGISNNNGIFYSKYDLTIQPDANSGNGIVSLNGILNFENETNTINYKDNQMIGFYDSVYQDRNQLLLDTGGTLQLGSGNQQQLTYTNEISGNEEDENVIISQGNEIIFYTNMEQGWQSKNSQYIDQTGKYNGVQTSQDKLETQRLIELTGDVTGSQSFDGSQNINITTTAGLSDYYTKTEMQTSGSSQVHWDNITNVGELNIDNWNDQYVALGNLLLIRNDINILSTGWVDDTEGTSGYWYYDISDSSINDTSFIEVYFNQDSQEYIDDINTFNTSFDGYVRLFQDFQPINDINCTIKIINDPGYSTTQGDIISIDSSRISGGTGITLSGGEQGSPVVFTVDDYNLFVKNTDTNISQYSWVLNESDFQSNDQTKVATQQSIKSYVDGEILTTTNYIDNEILTTTNYIDNEILTTTNYIDNEILTTTNYIDNEILQQQQSIETEIIPTQIQDYQTDTIIPNIESYVDGEILTTTNYIDSKTEKIYLDLYDSVGGLNVTQEQTLPFNQIRENSGQFDLSSGIITCDFLEQETMFLIHVDVSTDTTSTDRDNSYFWVEVSTNSGSTWTEIAGTRQFMYNRTSDNGEDTGSTSFIYSLNPDDSIRVRVKGLDATSVKTIANGSRIVLINI